jgi:nicotinamidase-related amidase
MAAGDVNDAEAPMHQDTVCVGVKAYAVRSAVGEYLTHPHAQYDVVVIEAVSRDYPGNTAHGRSVEQAECHGIA